MWTTVEMSYCEYWSESHGRREKRREQSDTEKLLIQQENGHVYINTSVEMWKPSMLSKALEKIGSNMKC